MEKQIDKETATSKLIELGKNSLEKGDSQKKLQTYHILAKGLKLLEQGKPVIKDQVLNCLDLFKLLGELHRLIVSAKNISSSSIPNIYEPTQDISSLLLKSIQGAIASGDKQYMTDHCEVLLTVSDSIRLDPELRRYGILDGKLKNAIGSLRGQAYIDSIFTNEEYEAFLKLTRKTGQILQGSDLYDIGKTLVKLIHATETIKNRYVNRISFLTYLRKYRTKYLEKIKERANQVGEQAKNTSLNGRRELVEELTMLENLEEYHQDEVFTHAISFIKKRILNHRIRPLETVFSEMINYLAVNDTIPDWIQYEMAYEKQHGENEIYNDSFYNSTLKDMTPQEASDMLQGKIKNLKYVELKTIRLIKYEEGLEERLKSIIEAFQESVG